MTAEHQKFNLPREVLADIAHYTASDQNSLIVTHDGRFHADEVLAIAMLIQLPQYKNASILRTRDESIIEKADVVVDVGQIYDPTKHRYDHHQASFNEVYNDVFGKITILSSCGLIYKHFGDQLLRTCFGMSNEAIGLCKDQIYENFILAFDASDNGVDIVSPDVSKKYTISTDLTSRIFRLNPFKDEDWEKEKLNRLFAQGVEAAIKDLWDFITYTKECDLKEAHALESFFQKRFEVHPSGRVIQFNQRLRSYDLLYTLEMKHGLKPSETILFIVYPYNKNEWRVRAANVAKGSFKVRVPFPEKYQGKSEMELQQLMKGLRFVHRNAFIAATDSLETAFKLIQETMALQ